MAKITKKNKRRVLIYTLLIIIIISYLGVFTFDYWTQILENKKYKIELEKDLTKLIEDEEDLNNEVTKMQDPNYVADYARQKYNLSGPTEIKIKFDEEESEN